MPPVQPITRNAAGLDFTPRFLTSSTVVGFPSAAAETIVCQLPAMDDTLAIVQGVWLSGVVSFTVGTSGSAIRVRIRQTNTSGTVVADTGAITGGVAATNLLSQDLQGFDTAPAGSQVYVLTLQVTAGAAASTVSATNLMALIV